MYLPLTARRREFFIYDWYQVIVHCQMFTQGELSDISKLKQCYCSIVHIVFNRKISETTATLYR